MNKDKINVNAISWDNPKIKINEVCTLSPDADGFNSRCQICRKSFGGPFTILRDVVDYKRNIFFINKKYRTIFIVVPGKSEKEITKQMKEIENICQECRYNARNQKIKK